VDVRHLLLLATVFTAIAFDVANRIDMLPQAARQIPRSVFTSGSPEGGAFKFAFEYGTGLRTFVPSAAPYAAAILALLAYGERPVLILMMGAFFGGGRAYAVAERASMGRLEWSELVARHGRSLEKGSSILAGLAIIGWFIRQGGWLY
jgi:hypothetical protein